MEALRRAQGFHPPVVWRPCVVLPNGELLPLDYDEATRAWVALIRWQQTIMSTYLDRAADECFLETARSPESVVRLAQTVDIPMDEWSHARMTVEVQLPPE